VIRRAKNKYQLSRAGEKDTQFSCESEFPDITERFTASLLVKLADGLDIQDAVEYAITIENQ
jgi:hypothetical protein